MSCDVATLLLAANLFLNQNASSSVMNPVCGCNCVSPRSAELRCYAAEAENLEKNLERVRAAVNEREKGKP